MEEWHPIAGWESLYEVSNLGRVRSLPRTQIRYNRGVRQVIRWKGKVLSPALCEGYPKVHLRDVQIGNEHLFVHRLVCEAFHGPAPEGHEVAHRDNNRANARADNVRWKSRLENVREKEIHGTQPKGEQIWNAQLTEERVREIRRSSETQLALSKRFGVSIMAVNSAKHGRTWRHVEGV